MPNAAAVGFGCSTLRDFGMFGAESDPSTCTPNFAAHPSPAMSIHAERGDLEEHKEHTQVLVGADNLKKKEKKNLLLIDATPHNFRSFFLFSVQTERFGAVV